MKILVTMPKGTVRDTFLPPSVCSLLESYGDVTYNDTEKQLTQEELKAALPSEALIVQAHPFRDKMTVCDPTPLFGIEGYNAGTEPFRNEMAKIFAAHYGKPLLSGSDLHHEKALGKGGIATDREIRSGAELTDVLRSGAYCLIEQGEIVNRRC